jgi:two-component system chemotaxis sensor kinase CheA
MQSIQELMDQLASAAMVADPLDLPLLAQMHTSFQTLAEQAGTAAAAGCAGPIRARANSAEKLLEQIILREATDAQQTLQRITDSITEIQGLLKGEVPATSVAAIATLPSLPEGETPPAQVYDERALNPDDVSLVQEFLGEARGHLDTAEAELLKVEESPENLEAVNAIFRSFHTIKGVAGFLNLKQIGALAHAAEGMLDLARKGQLALAGAAVDTVLEAIDLMKALILGLEHATTSGTAPAQEERLPGLLARIRTQTSGTSPPAASAPRATTSVAAAPGNSEPPAAPAAPAAASPAGPSATPAGNAVKANQENTAAETTVKVATDRLDNLINMVGELVIAQAMVAQDMTGLAAGNQRLSRNMGHLGKLTRELQDLSMSMRMVPIHGVFQKMARLVRDLARKSGKQIEFAVVGGETELDRNVVEAISDPLVHMVRNAADHGLENPEDRIAAGKPAAGRLQLKACHQAGNIVIEITDDGRGLNKARILKKAIDAGLVNADDELSDAEIFKLIFHAGLSTAEKVTDVSGRGVGMDVVRKNVEALRGRIEISSTEGHGSTFTIRLPLTLAVIDGLVVRVGTDRYIIPITSIEQSIQPKAEQISTVQNTGEMLLVRGSLLPLFRLYRLFKAKPRTEDPTQALVVIVQHDQKRCCLLVDELLGQQQVVIKSLGESIGAVRGISGGAILGDGAVSLILDVPGLVDLASHT